jgi:hypothetical protein
LTPAELQFQMQAQRMSHECTFDKHPTAQVRIKVTFSLELQDVSLRARTRLVFDFRKSEPSQIERFGTRAVIYVYIKRPESGSNISHEAGNFCHWYS